MKTLVTGFFAASLSLLVSTSNAASIRTIYKYPEGTWLENIFPMRNGSLLVSVVDTADIHLVNPYTSPAISTHITTFPSATGALGIAELSDNVFAVAVGNVTRATSSPVEDSFSVWRIDLRHASPRISKIADTPSISMINGLAALNPQTLLLADSWAGNIASLNVNTGETTTVLQHATLASDHSNPIVPLGVNGLKFHNSYVYYSNTAASLVGRVKVDRRTGKAVRPFEIIAQSDEVSVPDDIAVAEDGSVFVARPFGDMVQRVRRGGSIETIASGGEVKGATAVAFGRTKRDKGTLYVSTSGGLLSDGATPAGGKVVAIDL